MGNVVSGALVLVADRLSETSLSIRHFVLRDNRSPKQSFPESHCMIEASRIITTILESGKFVLRVYFQKFA